MSTDYTYYDMKYLFYKKYIEQTTELLRKNFKAYKRSQRRKVKPDQEYMKSILHILKSVVGEITEEKFNKYFNNSTFIFLFSTFEGDLKQICNVGQDARGYKIGINEIAGANYIEKAKTYFTKMMGLNLDAFNSEWDKIKTAQKIRNLMAHNGSTIPLEETKPVSQQSVIYKLVSTSEHFVLDEKTGEFHISDPQYLLEFCDNITCYLNGVLAHVDEASNAT